MSAAASSSTSAGGSASAVLPLTGGLKAPNTVVPSDAASRIDKSAFVERLALVCIRIPTTACATFLKRFQRTAGLLLSRPRLRHVIEDMPESHATGTGLTVSPTTKLQATASTATAAAANIPIASASGAAVATAVPVVDTKSNSAASASDTKADSKQAAAAGATAAGADGKAKNKKQKAKKESRQQPKNTAPTRLLLLNESVDEKLSTFPADLREFIATNGGVVTTHTLILDYEYFSIEQILRKALPAGVAVPTGFETVGHLAHLNLNAEQLPHKYLIGQVYIDKLYPRVQTIVNKIGTVSNEYRVFDMEVLAGKPDFNCEVREHSCRFKFDFSRVYWNSRLQTEHARIVSLLSRSDVLCDMFCGIGPFAIPAVKQSGCTVYANDLNPNSFHYLNENAKLNGIALSGPNQRLFTHNGDARAFIRALAARQLRGEPIPPFTHITMNLPAAASTFCDVFRGLYNVQAIQKELTASAASKSATATATAAAPTDVEIDSASFVADAAAVTRLRAALPVVHCYYFSKAPEEQWKVDVIQEVERVLGYRFPAGERPAVHNVRLVAPAKMMLCISFRIPVAVAFDAPRLYASDPIPLPFPDAVEIRKAPPKPIRKRKPTDDAPTTGSSADGVDDGDDTIGGDGGGGDAKDSKSAMADANDLANSAAAKRNDKRATNSTAAAAAAATTGAAALAGTRANKKHKS